MHILGVSVVESRYLKRVQVDEMEDFLFWWEKSKFSIKSL